MRVDEQHPIAHSKVIVADGETVVTGSYRAGRPRGSRARLQHREQS